MCIRGKEALDYLSGALRSISFIAHQREDLAGFSTPRHFHDNHYGALRLSSATTALTSAKIWERANACAQILSYALIVWTSLCTPISTDIKLYLETDPCALKMPSHTRPDANVTRECWETGRLCKTDRQHFRAIHDGVVADRWLLMRQGTSLYDCSHWRGFVSSAPAGQLPDLKFCGESYAFGKCPRSDWYVFEGGLMAAKVYPL